MWVHHCGLCLRLVTAAAVYFKTADRGVTLTCKYLFGGGGRDSRIFRVILEAGLVLFLILCKLQLKNSISWKIEFCAKCQCQKKVKVTTTYHSLFVAGLKRLFSWPIFLIMQHTSNIASSSRTKNWTMEKRRKNVVTLPITHVQHF